MHIYTHTSTLCNQQDGGNQINQIDMHIYTHIHYVINKMAANKCKRPVNFNFEMPVTKVKKQH